MKLYKIKKSDIDKRGRGLYATRNIKEGTKIIDYVGKLITKKQTEESDKYDNSKPIYLFCLLYTSPSPRDRQKSRMPSSA